MTLHNKGASDFADGEWAPPRDSATAGLWSEEDIQEYEEYTVGWTNAKCQLDFNNGDYDPPDIDWQRTAYDATWESLKAAESED